MGESAALVRLLARWPENKINPSLDRIEKVLQALGNPENSFKSIHIAGTNGKTSTARMVQQLVLELNLRTGLYTSPHLTHPRERIVVDGNSISKNDFEGLLTKFEPILELVEQQLKNEKFTFFEAITAMAFMQFSEVPIEVGVIEVGMGGSWDATNLITGEVNLITPISLDHQDYLGNSLSEIASEKAGILKPAKPAVIAKQSNQAEAVLKKRISELGIEAFWQEEDFRILRREMAHGGQIFDLKTPFGVYNDIFMKLFGEFQTQNASLAIMAVELFIDDKLEEETIQVALEKVTSPGRVEVIARNPTVIIDAAHNPAGVKVSRQAIEEGFNFKEIVLIFGCMQDKDAEKMLKELREFASKVILTSARSERAMSFAILSEFCKESIPESEILFSGDLPFAIKTAIDYAKSQENCGVVVMGSIALAGAVKSLL